MPALRILALALPLLLLVACGRVEPPRGVRPVTVKMTTTGYCKCQRCCGWHRTWYGKPVFSSGPNKGKAKKVGITASGERARVGTIAADRSRYPFGTIMYVEGYGYGRVEDVGGAIKGNHIDLYFKSHAAALAWGKKTQPVQVWYQREASRR
jgi:3D (Asp-Asp-Asp) domain-containing protein